MYLRPTAQATSQSRQEQNGPGAAALLAETGEMGVRRRYRAGDIGVAVGGRDEPGFGRRRGRNSGRRPAWRGSRVEGLLVAGEDRIVGRRAGVWQKGRTCPRRSDRKGHSMLLRRGLPSPCTVISSWRSGDTRFGARRAQSVARLAATATVDSVPA